MEDGGIASLGRTRRYRVRIPRTEVSWGYILGLFVFSAFLHPIFSLSHTFLMYFPLFPHLFLSDLHLLKFLFGVLLPFSFYWQNTLSYTGPSAPNWSRFVWLFMISLLLNVFLFNLLSATNEFYLHGSGVEDGFAYQSQRSRKTSNLYTVYAVEVSAIIFLWAWVQCFM